MNLKPATPAQVRAVELALGHLLRARELLTEADTPNTLQRVRLAITSAKGAQRHVIRRATPRAAPPVLTQALRSCHDCGQATPNRFFCHACMAALVP